jgi:RecA-family ATPase
LPEPDLDTDPTNPANPLVAELTGKEVIVRWILPDFIPEGVLFAVAGSPGAGKSYLFYTIGLALAAGIPVLGMTPRRPSRILYFDEENSGPDRIQYERWAWNGLGQPNLDLLAENFWCSSFTLGGNDWDQKAEAEILLRRPNLFIIDTTTPACHIEDENDNGEASRVIQKIRRLQGLTDPAATAIVLKHAKLREDGEGYTLRGAKSWEGAVDSIVYLTKGRGKPRQDALCNTTLTPSKTRAFGLRHKLHIRPEWVGNQSGIRLTATSPELEEPQPLQPPI